MQPHARAIVWESCLQEDTLPGQFIPEIAIFETVNPNDAALPRQCGLCSANPPLFGYRFGEFADGTRTGHCCTPCACRYLMEMAERAASGGSTKSRDAS